MTNRKTYITLEYVNRMLLVGGGPSVTFLVSIRRIKSKTSNVSCLVLQLPLSNPLKPGIKSRVKMLLEQCQQAMLQWSTVLLPTRVRLIYRLHMLIVMSISGVFYLKYTNVPMHEPMW